eukprot:scaffold952_cov249-Pinguiococcus_pyrenoidosus.AAC.13
MSLSTPISGSRSSERHLKRRARAASRTASRSLSSRICGRASWWAFACSASAWPASSPSSAHVLGGLFRGAEVLVPAALAEAHRGAIVRGVRGEDVQGPLEGTRGHKHGKVDGLGEVGEAVERHQRLLLVADEVAAAKVLHDVVPGAGEDNPTLRPRVQELGQAALHILRADRNLLDASSGHAAQLPVLARGQVLGLLQILRGGQQRERFAGGGAEHIFPRSGSRPVANRLRAEAGAPELRAAWRSAPTALPRSCRSRGLHAAVASVVPDYLRHRRLQSTLGNDLLRVGVGQQHEVLPDRPIVTDLAEVLVEADDHARDGRNDRVPDVGVDEEDEKLRDPHRQDAEGHEQEVVLRPTRVVHVVVIQVDARLHQGHDLEPVRERQLHQQHRRPEHDVRRGVSEGGVHVLARELAREGIDHREEGLHVLAVALEHRRQQGRVELEDHADAPDDEWRQTDPDVLPPPEGRVSHLPQGRRILHLLAAGERPHEVHRLVDEDHEASTEAQERRGDGGAIQGPRDGCRSVQELLDVRHEVDRDEDGAENLQEEVPAPVEEVPHGDAGKELEPQHVVLEDTPQAQKLGKPGAVLHEGLGGVPQRLGDGRSRRLILTERSVLHPEEHVRASEAVAILKTRRAPEELVHVVVVVLVLVLDAAALRQRFHHLEQGHDALLEEELRVLLLHGQPPLHVHEELFHALVVDEADRLWHVPDVGSLSPDAEVQHEIVDQGVHVAALPVRGALDHEVRVDAQIAAPRLVVVEDLVVKHLHGRQAKPVVLVATMVPQQDEQVLHLVLDAALLESKEDGQPRRRVLHGIRPEEVVRIGGRARRGARLLGAVHGLDGIARWRRGPRTQPRRILVLRQLFVVIAAPEPLAAQEAHDHVRVHRALAQLPGGVGLKQEAGDGHRDPHEQDGEEVAAPDDDLLPVAVLEADLKELREAKQESARRDEDVHADGHEEAAEQRGSQHPGELRLLEGRHDAPDNEDDEEEGLHPEVHDPGAAQHEERGHERAHADAGGRPGQHERPHARADASEDCERPAAGDAEAGAGQEERHQLIMAEGAELGSRQVEEVPPLVLVALEGGPHAQEDAQHAQEHRSGIHALLGDVRRAHLEGRVHIRGQRHVARPTAGSQVQRPARHALRGAPLRPSTTLPLRRELFKLSRGSSRPPLGVWSVTARAEAKNTTRSSPVCARTSAHAQIFLNYQSAHWMPRLAAKVQPMAWPFHFKIFPRLLDGGPSGDDDEATYRGPIKALPGGDGLEEESSRPPNIACYGRSGTLCTHMPHDFKTAIRTAPERLPPIFASSAF